MCLWKEVVIITQVVLENATLADVIRRAVSVAPTRGDAFDKCAGIVMKIDPNANSQIVVMASDTVLFYMEAVTAVEITGDAVTWRIPSMIFGALVSKLPIGAGATITLDDSLERSRLVVKSKRMVAKLNLLSMDYYTLWDTFDTSGLVAVDNLGERIRQISWANTGQVQDLDGIGFGPNFIGATDRYRMASVMIETGCDGLFLVPSKTLAAVLPEQGEVRIGRSGDLFLVEPNEYTQIYTSIIDKFVDLPSFMNKQHFEYSSTFNKTEAVKMLAQALDFKGGDRLSRISVYLGKCEFAIHCDNPELGMLGNVIEMHGDAVNHGRIKIDFNPDNLRAALASFPTETVTIQYNPEPKTDEEKRRGKKVFLTDGGSYRGLVAPLAEPKKEEEE